MKPLPKRVLLLGAAYLLCYMTALCRPHTWLLGVLWAIVTGLLLIVLAQLLWEKQ